MVIAPLASKLTLDSGGFRDGMSAADRATVRFSQSMAAQAERIGKSRVESRLLTLEQRGASEATLTAARAAAAQVAALEAKAKAEADAQKRTEALDADVARLTQRLSNQADTFGLTSRQAEIYELKQRGVSEATLEAARAADVRLTKLETQAKAEAEASRRNEALQSDVARLTQRLTQQADTFGLTTSQTELYELKQRGASDATLEAARSVARQVERLEQEAEAQKRAAQLTEAATSKKQRYAREVADLRGHLQAGRISQEVFNRSVLESADRLDISRRAAMRMLPIHERLADGALRAGRAMGSVGSWAAGAARMGLIAGGIAAAGLAAIIAKSSESIDKTAKVSDALGIQTQKLNGLRHAADLAGTDNDTFDKSLTRMVRGVGEAARGTGAAGEAFKQLGLPIEQLMAMSPDQQFAAIADAMNGVENQTTKVALATKIFGKEGASLINTLNLGSAGLAASQTEAEKLGIAFDRVDAAKVEAANDAISRVKAGVTGVGQTLTVALAPYLEAASNKLLEMATSGEGMGSRVSAAIGWVSSAVAYAADFIELPKAAFYGLRAVATGQLALIADGVQGIIDGTVYLLNLLPGVELEASRVAGALADEAWLAAAEAGDQAAESWDRFQRGANSQAVAGFIADVQAKADAAAQAVATAAEKAPAILDAEAVSEEVTKIDGELSKLQQDLERFGASPIDVKLLDLAEAGATVEQLDRARATMEQIARLEREAERRENIESTLEDIEQRVRTFGLTEEERTLLDLEAAGATEEQLARAEAAFNKLSELEAGKDLTDTLASASTRSENNALRAGSAEAQLAAFRGSQSSGGGAGGQLDETKRQTSLQERMVKSLETLERGGGNITVTEVDL